MGVKRIFQFTPPRGGRLPTVAGLRSLTVFQFTPPRGGRLDSRVCRMISWIFQFTPPRGGRPRRLQTVDDAQAHFNSRPRAGGDADRLSEPRRTFEFQFTPPRGGRPQRPERFANLLHFNSRPRAGGDGSMEKGEVIEHISIHAPARGATWRSFYRGGTKVFQFTPPRGGRPAPVPYVGASLNFNSRPRAGGDPQAAVEAWREKSIFQFTPPRGGRRLTLLL